MVLKYGITLILALCLASPLMAQEPVEAAEDGAEYPNTLDFLVAATTETDPTSSAFTVGIGYLRRLTPLWTLGAAGELSTGDTLREWLLFVNVYVRPVGGLLLGTGPGIEGAQEREEEGGEVEQSNAFAWRFLAAWEFEVGSRYTISPELNLDLIGGSVVWVYGVAFGVMF